MGKVFLFQYGSNLDTERLNSEERLAGAAHYVGMAQLSGFRLAFDLFSMANVSAAADIVADPSSTVIGALYAVEESYVIDPAGGMSKMDRVENARPDGTGNYARHVVSVLRSDSGRKEEAFTYIGTEAARMRFDHQVGAKTISEKYLGHILGGAHAKGFPAEYIAGIELLAQGHNRAYGEGEENE